MSDISIAAMASAVQHLVGNATNLSVRISFEARPNSRPTRACSSRTTARFNRKVVESGGELKGFGPTAEAPRLATEAQSVGRPNVTIQDAGSIGELIAAAATVATLVYLAAQIRSNTNSVEANSVHAVTSLLGDVNRSMIENSEVARIDFEGRRNFSNLDPVEQLRFSGLMANRFRQFEDMHHHYRRGLLNDARWRVQRQVIAAFLGNPGVAEWWRTIASVGFPEEFVAEVNSLLERMAQREDQQ